MHTPSIAACTFKIESTGGAIQLFPAGAFKARDGRPKEVQSGHWLITADIAARLIAKVLARSTDLVIDYEHQTLNSAENGQPAPAAGWFHGLEWRTGAGLFATDTRWTDRAKAMIEAGEYRYLSPVFSYDRKTGEVLDLHHVGLTNFPALDGMDALPALAAARFSRATDEVEHLVQAGLTAGRLLPIQERWARELGSSSIAALKGYLEKTPTIPTSSSSQIRERQDTPRNITELPPEALAVCSSLGVSPDDYLAALKNEPSWRH